jgi:hypothetical protein
MKRVQTITIGGTSYILPEDMDIKTRTQMAAALLLLQQLDHEYDTDYKTYWFESDRNLTVNFGWTEVHDNKATALMARDARNQQLAREKEAAADA